MAGKHCVQELYKADSYLLNDEAFVREALVGAASVANATLLDVSTHLFEPQGVTGFVLLAESHISIHTWPELGYAAVDVYTCGTSTVPEKACEYLYERFNAKKQQIQTILRPVPKFTCV